MEGNVLVGSHCPGRWVTWVDCRRGRKVSTLSSQASIGRESEEKTFGLAAVGDDLQGIMLAVMEA